MNTPFKPSDCIFTEKKPSHYETSQKHVWQGTYPFPQNFGYSITKQHDSHIKLTTTLNGAHHITIPDHHSLKLGTLHGILIDIAKYHQMDKLEVLRTVFKVA